MKVSYDKSNDALYVHLCGRAGDDAREVEEGVVFDFDASGALVGAEVQHASQRSDFTQSTVACTYRADEDLFHLRLSNMKIVREASPDWHCNVS